MPWSIRGEIEKKRREKMKPKSASEYPLPFFSISLWRMETNGYIIVHKRAKQQNQLNKRVSLLNMILVGV